jgi:AcrR family transcriptional regulator
MTDVPARDRIVQCALDEIEKNGIVGLRVADVAIGADVSVPLIYKYFRDRDGLLAEALSSTIASNFLGDIVKIHEFVNKSDHRVTARDLADMIPMPNDPRRQRNRKLRAMAIAASYDIPKLAEAMDQCQRDLTKATAELVDSVRKRTNCTSPLSLDVVVLVLQALGLGLIVSDVAPTTRPSDKEYNDYLVDFIGRHIVGGH